MAAGRVNRNWYRGARWRRLRRLVIEQQGGRCADCGNVSALELHHRTRATADPAQFFDRENVRAVCRACHFRETARERREKPATFDDAFRSLMHGVRKAS